MKDLIDWTTCQALIGKYFCLWNHGLLIRGNHHLHTAISTEQQLDNLCQSILTDKTQTQLFCLLKHAIFSPQLLLQQWVMRKASFPCINLWWVVQDSLGLFACNKIILLFSASPTPAVNCCKKFSGRKG